MVNEWPQLCYDSAIFMREDILAQQTNEECCEGDCKKHEFVRINKEKEECMKSSARRCRKLRCSKVPFSNKLNKLGGRIKL